MAGNSTDGNPRRVLVIHSEMPGPAGNDARLRQLHRQIAAVAAAPEVHVTAITTEGGRQVLEPAGFAALGIHVESVDGHPARWLRERHGEFDVVLTTDVHPASIERALVAIGGRRVMLLHRLASYARASAELDFKVPDAAGLNTMVASLRHRERLAFDRCDAIICAHGRLAEAAEATGTTTPVTVVCPPIAPVAEGGGVGAKAAVEVGVDGHQGSTAGGGVLHVGRWATGTSADAVGLRSILTSEAATSARLDRRMVLLGEDVFPAGRQIGRDFPRCTLFPFSAGHAFDRAVDQSRLGLSFRSTGPGVPARLLEMAGRGLPWVASAAAMAGLPQRWMLDAMASPSAEAASAITVELLSDHEQLAERADQLQRHARTYADHDQQIELLLDAVGITAAPPPAATAAAPPLVRPMRGALDFTPEMQQFEYDLLPEPVLDRDQTALLQPQMTEDERYRLRIRTHEGPDYFERLRKRVADLGNQPTFSILMPTWNIDRPTLLSAVESVRSQVYPHWQLCVVDDASTEAATREAVASLPQLDDRISVRLLDDNRGIAGSTTEALAMATGDFIGLLDHDDELRPDALWWNAHLLDLRPELDLIYSDEDKLNEEGERWWPFHKPDWSPAMLTNVNYINHFLVVRRALVEKVGGYRPGFDGAQDYDLVLRLTEATERHRIGHIAKVLYSWRTIEGSTAADIEAKPEAHSAGHRALSDALARQDRNGWVEDGSVPTVHRVRHHVPDDVRISVLIPTKDRVDLLEPCLHSLREHTQHPNYEIVIVDNNTSDPETLDWLQTFERNGVSDGDRVVRYPHQFNFARQMNLAASVATGDLLLILNNDVQIHVDGWMRAMAEQALLPDVGVVGARLLFPDGRTQHEGIGIGMAGPAVNLSFGGHRGYDQFIRDVIAVTGAVAMVRSTLFADVGGFDERLRVAFNDVDLCLRIGERGYRNIYTPLAELAHPESASRGSLHPIPDEDLFHARWGMKGQLRDPWLNANFEWFFPLLYKL